MCKYNFGYPCCFHNSVLMCIPRFQNLEITFQTGTRLQALAASLDDALLTPACCYQGSTCLWRLGSHSTWNDEIIVGVAIGGGGLVLGSAAALRLIRERAVAHSRNGNLADRFQCMTTSLNVQVSPADYEGTLEEEILSVLREDLSRVQQRFAKATTPMQRIFARTPAGMGSTTASTSCWSLGP